jgi:hypothetical protein
VRHDREKFGGVLVIGMEHDDDIGIHVQGGAVTGFLVGAVAAVLGMDDDVT